VVLGDAKPIVMADLGHGDMDAAMVEAAVHVLRKQSTWPQAGYGCPINHGSLDTQRIQGDREP